MTDFFLSVTEAFLGSAGLYLGDKGARWLSESPLKFAERSKMKVGLLRKSEKEYPEWEGSLERENCCGFME